MKFSDWLYRISTGKVTLAAFLILGVFVVLFLPKFNQTTSTYDQGVGSPDTRFFYLPQDLVKMAETYGEAGRKLFINTHWTIDLAFPIIYTASFLTATSYFRKKAQMNSSRSAWLNLLPLGAMLFDLSENAATSLVMTEYPLVNDVVLFLAPWMTLLKWVLFILCVLQVLFSLILWIYRFVSMRDKKPASLL